MKAMKITGAAVAVLIVILVLLMVVGIPSGFLTSTIQDRVERASGYHLTIAGATKISLWPTLNVALSDLTLQDPKDRDGSSIITKPVAYMPLLRERLRPTAPPNKTASLDTDSVTIDRITISNGAVIFSNARDRVVNRIDGI